MNPTIALRLIILISTALPSGIGVVISDVAINQSKIALVLTTLAIAGLIYSKNQLSFQANKSDVQIIYFGAALILSSMAAGIINKSSIGVSIAFSINAMAWFYSYFSVYFLSRTIATNKEIIKSVERFIIIVLLVCAAIGILEFFLKINFFGKIADVIGLKDTGGVTSILYRDDRVRARSSFDQSIALGFAMILGVILVEKSDQNKKLLGYIAIGIFISALLLSFSRSSLAIYIFYKIYTQYKSGKMFKKMTIVSGAAILAIALASNFDKIFYIDDSLDSGDGNLLVRFRDFEFVGYCLDDYPIFGLGAGFLHNNQAFEKAYPQLFSFYDGALDNMFLGILVEYGAIGLLSFALFMYSIVKNKIDSTPAQKNALLGLLLVGVGGSLSYDFFVFPGVGRLFLIILGLITSEIDICKEENRK
jgi:O-antigen ligase